MCGNTQSRTSTILVVILDESGSMAPKKAEVLRGFNDFLKEQKAVVTDSAKLFLVKFSSTVRVMHSGIPLRDVPRLTGPSYYPSGKTALYDAIAIGVRLAERHKKSRDRVLCVIMTDGAENASRETTLEQVTKIVSDHEALGDWTFAYIGKNPEQWAKDTKMAADNVVPYDDRDVRKNLATFSAAVTAFRSQSTTQSTTVFVGKT